MVVMVATGDLVALIVKAGTRNWWDSRNGMATIMEIADTRPMDRSSYWELCQRKPRTHPKIPTGTIPLLSSLRVVVTRTSSMLSLPPRGMLFGDWWNQPTILLQRRTKGSHIRPIESLVDVEEVGGILIRH